MVYLFVNDNIKNIIVKNNSYLNDDYIIDLAGVKNYPSFWLTSTIKMQKKLNNSPYIEKVSIKRKFYNVLEFDIKENVPLFVYEGDHKVVFENKNTVNVDEEITLFRIPRLMNYVPDNKYDSFIKGLKK